jgi:hypothetical protein
MIAAGAPPGAETLVAAPASIGEDAAIRLIKASTAMYVVASHD